MGLKLVCKKKALLFLTLFFCAFCGAQTPLDNIIGEYITDLSKVWNKHNTITFNNLLVNDTLPVGVDFKFPVITNQNKQKNIQLSINEQEQLIFKRDIGIQLVGNYQRNYRSPVADPDEIVIFKQKAQIGLDWDLFRQGLYENRIKYRQLKYENKAIALQKMQQSLLNIQQKNIKDIIRLFNTLKLQVIETRRQLLNEQKPIVDKLFALKQVSKDNYIKLIQNQTDIEGQTAIYTDYNVATDAFLSAKPTGNEIPPLVDIDIEKLFRITNTALSDSSAYYFMYAQNYQGNYFLRDMSLKASVKYNFYDIYDTQLPNRSFLSVGVNFALPLVFNRSNKKELNRLQAELIQEKSRVNNVVAEDQNYFFVNTFYDYRYKLKQYFNLMQKRAAFEELIRTEQVKQKMNDVEFNPNTALTILNDYWSTAIELLDLKQDMYKLLLNINSKLPDSKLTDYIKPIENRYLQPNKEKNFKAVYIWSDVFKNYDIKLISDYCNLNEFTRLLVSYNTDKSYCTKVNEFISKNYTKHIALMIGNNKLLINQNMSSYLDSLKKVIDLTFVKEIHLDIEPHAMDGFKENKDTYFKKYLQLLAQAKQFTDKNKLSLSVSIPLHYPLDVLKEIFASCSDVYFMAYENIKPEHISEKLKEEFAIDPNKVVIALRTKDFNNRASMDQLFRTIKAKKIAYHDLDDLISFDKKSVNNKNSDEK